MEDEIREMKEEARQSWFDMVDTSMEHIFMARTASIRAGLLTEEEADTYFAERGKYHMDKCDAMTNREINTRMLERILEGLIGMKEEK